MADSHIQEILKRRISGAFPSLEDATQAISRRPGQVFYVGIDPTGPSLHLGHTVPLLLLKDLAKSGHTAVVLLGDFTAQIGDPTGKLSARISLTQEQVRENMRAYGGQIKSIFQNVPFILRQNSEWLAPMTLTDVLGLASRATVQQMIARDMFQERQKAGKPIFVSEFLYPLMQGYDSVALQADGEIGGNDQTFNMLVGRDLEKEILQKEKVVLATQLLVDSSSGKKMSKTEGGLIALADAPQTIREKILNTIPDEMVRTVFLLCTEKEVAWIEEKEAARKRGEDVRLWKEELAEELIRMYQGEDAVGMAKEAFTVTGDGMRIIDALKDWGVAGSLSQAKDLVSGSSVKINGSAVTAWDAIVRAGDEVRVGKGKVFRVS